MNNRTHNLLIMAIALVFLAGFTPGGQPDVVVHPVEIDTAFKNPGMGWLIYVYGHPTAIPSQYHTTPYSSAVYCNYFIWRDLEPNYEGDYRWEVIDNFIAYWADPARNKKISIGMHLTDPHSIPGPIHIPQWLYDDPRMSGRWYDNWYGNKCERKFEPEYWNPFFLEKLGKFWKAMAEKYYSSPIWQKYIERIDISTYGYWGEWHSEIKWPDEQTKVKTLRTMMDQYVEAFPRDRVPTPMLAKDIVGWHGKKDLRDHGVYYAVEELNAMMVRRCMGWPEAAQPHELEFILNHYKTNKFHAEWGSIDGSLYTFPTGMNTYQAAKMALDLHASMLGWYRSGGSSQTCALNQIVPETGETIEDYFQKRCGYRLVLSEACYPGLIQPGQTMELSQTWYQKGVARLYEDYFRLRAYLEHKDQIIELNVDKHFDATKWLKGGPYSHTSRFRVPDEIPSGQYVLKIAVVDFTGKPAMNLAIAGKDEVNPNLYGRYPLGRITIGSAGETEFAKPLFNASDTPLIEHLWFNKDAVKRDGDGWYGIRVTVGDRPVRVTAVGRYALEGNSHVHPVKIVRFTDRRTIATSKIDMSDPYVDESGFKYGLIDALLQPRSSYFILNQESPPQDLRLDYVKVKVNRSEHLTLDAVGWDNSQLNIIRTNMLDDAVLGGMNIRYRLAWQPQMQSLVQDVTAPQDKHYAGMKITVRDRAVKVREIGTRYEKDNNGAVNLAVVRVADKKAISWGNLVNLDLGYANTKSLKYVTTDILLQPNQSYYVLRQLSAAIDLKSSVPIEPSPDFTIDGPVRSINMKTFELESKQNHTAQIIDLRYEYYPYQSLITSVSLSPERLNGPTGWYGMKITVGPKPIEVSQIGRYRRGKISSRNTIYKERGEGLSDNHQFRIVRVNDLRTLAGVAVGIWGKTDTLGFGYGVLGQPLLLEPHTSYYVLCNEMKDGDLWYSEQTKVSSVEEVTIDGPVKTVDFRTFDYHADPGHTYGPVNLHIRKGG